MDLQFSPETEAKLNNFARRTRRGTDELLDDALDDLEAAPGSPDDNPGEAVPVEEVRLWLETHHRGQMPPARPLISLLNMPELNR